MAQQYTNADGITLINPGTYVSTQVQSNQGNIAAAGVVTLIGEADEGPVFSAEQDLSLNAYTPDQIGAVIQKYGSGRIIDAFRAVVAAANDPAIVGGVSLVRIVKTNNSIAASSTISRSGFSSYAILSAKREGLSGNTIKYQSLAVNTENAPTTGEFAYCPAVSGTISFDTRVNGGPKNTITVTAKMEPTALRSAIESVSQGILVNGGNKKTIIPASGLTISATAPAADQLVVTLQTGQVWSDSPAVGDTVVIPANGDYSAAQDSAIAGPSLENVGSYIIISLTNTVTSATLTLKRITPGTCVAASGTTASDKLDIIAYKPLEIKNATGQDRGSLVGIAGTYNILSNNGSQAVIQVPAPFTAMPKVGDYAKFASSFGTINQGFYTVVSATSNTVTISRLSEGSSGTGSGSVTIATPPTLATQPFRIEKQDIDGLGKSLAIEGNVGAIFRNKNTTLDANLSNSFKVSASEYKHLLSVSKGIGVSESFASGGDIVVTIGCSQEDATMEILSDKIDFKISSSLIFSAPFSQFKTMKDLVDFINSQTSFSASLTSTKWSAISPSKLDKGTYTISGLPTVKAGRIKKDASDFNEKVNGSGLIKCSMISNSGLPEVSNTSTFLANGAKGGTTSADVIAAIDACEDLSTNFIVPLFSVDATEDIALEETDSSSTYTIDAINAYVKSHVIKMSELKQRSNRIAIVSKRDTYNNIKEAAGEMASFRVAMCFQDCKNISSDGTIKQYQPWMTAIIAAGMQSAAGFRGIVKKFANVSGIITPYNDFNPNNPGDSEDALKSGLLFMEKVPTGGFRWVSDQMTYSIDNNFVYNSLQAVYLADLMTLTLIDRFDRLVVGKSVAEISAAAGYSILEAEMFNFKRLRWITSSDDAPKGFKNAVVRISGGVMEISVEVKLAGLIYFVPISLTISQVTQEAAE